MKKRRVSAPVRPPAPAPWAGRQRRWQVAVLMLALAGLAGSGIVLGLRHRQQSRIRAELPVVPAVLPSPTLADLIAQAQRTSPVLDGVAELGRLYHANGLVREAGACWRILQREQPREARWPYYLANLARSEGDYALAEEQLGKTVALDPRYAPAWLRLAEMKFKSGRADAAQPDYQRRLELVPGDPYAELGLARLAQQQGRPDETRQRLERLLARDPKFSAAQNLYAELLAAAGQEEQADYHRWLGREAGRFREAEDPWLDELGRWCHDSRQLCHLGTIAYQTSQGDRGRSYFERAIAENPGDPLAYQLLGELLLETGATGAARDTLQRGIAQASSPAPAPTHYLTLSQAEEKLGAPDRAMQVLTEGLRRHPDSAELHHGLGVLLAALGQPLDAIAAYRQALTLNPALAEADFSLAVALLEAGRRDEAVQALQHSLVAQPTFPKSRLLLGRLAMDAGRLDEAGDYLLPLLKANPGMPEIRQIMARWHLQAGLAAVARQEVRAGVDHFRAGLGLQPDEPNLNANLGVQLLGLGQPAEAVPFLEKYRQLQPGDLRGALFLGQAYAQAGRIAEARPLLASTLQQAEQAGNAAVAAHCREVMAALPR